MEELYYGVPEYPRKITLEGIHGRASLQFEYMNCYVTGFETPTQVHPKNPCTYYEDNSYGKATYKYVPEHLVGSSSSIYFEESYAEVSLKSISHKIKLY
ncbi:hypothetical protein PY092_16365 [Muricauda sp. 334s03]|uniref:Uncharacterized protein n=1 Tax=Flagellimonas yonaguniensis TaxID=3031325 RepID=A0ABT5Y2R1_9FLAO|nr:hypothetical protein [[Muricauda] yonaguniensis]MDF0717738.1 hypothetical protein [[Muricauda] yonaguniensis]